jgi:amino acid adenylation domain-containing protein
MKQVVVADAERHVPLAGMKLPMMAGRADVPVTALDWISCSEATGHRIRTAADSLGVTAAQICLAAYSVLLHRLTGAEEIAVTFEAEPRRSSPCRIQVRQGASLRQVLGGLRSLATSFDTSSADRGVSSGIGDDGIACVVRASRAAGVEPNQDVKESDAADRDAVSTVFVLQLNERRDGLAAEFEFSARLPAPWVREWVRAFERVIDFAIDNPDASVQRLQVARLDPGVTGGDPTPTPRWRPIHEMIAETASRCAFEPAVVDTKGRSLTYAELDQRSNQLAHRLRRAGVGPECRVAIAMPRVPGLVVAMLATLKAGAAYVPLDLSWPEARRRQVLEAARPSILLIGSGTAGSDGFVHTCDTIELDDLGREAGVLAMPTTDPAVSLHPDHAAYVLFTSGSTGTPKGVMVSHRGIPILATASRAWFNLGAGRRVLQFSVSSFDASVFEVFPTLAAGDAIVMADADELLPGHGLAQLITSLGVSNALIPPSVLQNMPDVPLPGLTTLIAGGEPCTAAIAARWGSGRTFINAYGPTEGTVIATAYHWPAGGQQSSIGRHLPGVTVYLLDDTFEPVLPGAAGELCVAGPTVARGYIASPSLTAQSFVPDPFGAPGSRMYRTGDLARWLPDGTLEHLGRRDSQVKVHGCRVELDEVKTTIERWPEVRQAAVVDRRNGSDGTFLVAYVVPLQAVPDGRRAFLDRLRLHVSESLPRYMVPSRFVIVDELPRKPSGKLDLDALRAMEGAQTAVSGLCMAQNAREATVRNIWESLLGRTDLEASESFFELGGSSLLLAKMQWELKRRLQIDVPIADLFANPTIASLTQYVLLREGATGALEGEGSDDRALAHGRISGRRRLRAMRAQAVSS